MAKLADLIGYDRADTSVARAVDIPSIERELGGLAAHNRTTVAALALLDLGLDSAESSCPCWSLPHGACPCVHHTLHKRAQALIREGYPEDAVRGAFDVMLDIHADDIEQMIFEIRSIADWFMRLGMDTPTALRSAERSWANGLRPNESIVTHEGQTLGQCEVCGEMMVELHSTRKHGSVCFECLTWVAPQQADTFPRLTFMERVNLGTLPTHISGGSIVADPWAPSGA